VPPIVTPNRSQNTRENWNKATPVTSAGTISGDRQNALIASRPRKLPRDLFGVTIGGTIAGLVIGHLTFAIPFVIRSVLASHTRFDHSLEEAAANLGATPLQTFFRVTLPILKPGIASGAIFAFLISLDEVPIALFMGGGDATTLPVKIFTAIEISFGGDILAVASLVVCGSVVLMLILDRLVGLERLFATKN
jgi:putative spermidine/putrescine transport system permease protein